MTDILTDENGEVLTDNGDFVTGNSDYQHQHFLLLFQKGELKEKPDVGTGLINFLNESDIDGMLREIRIQFEKDGMEVKALGFDEQLGKLNYDANYPG